MAKLNAAARKRLPAADFAGPDRSYPVPDKAHAANAKARASQAVNAGRMSTSTEAKIDAKADRMMGKKPARGERTATHNDTKHPSSHDEWMKLGSD
jgi:hypothetical protein